ncbi:MAG: NAD(P)/FAD-dependent oxidoreductase [Pyrinomonadaceae bacterium]
MRDLGGKPRIAIAGAGPAGSSLAIRLAARGFDVTLIERERFPRHKLCGEFISPECLGHFDEMGAGDAMLAAGGKKIRETRFYDRRGHSFAIPSGLLESGGFALSLSRYEMDRCLMDRARRTGVKVIEGTRVCDVVIEGGNVTELAVVDDERLADHIDAGLFVDATGRSAILAKLLERKLPTSKIHKQRSLAVGFKTHLRGARVAPGTCEIFAFPGGYGGLTTIEDDLANLCFIMKPGAARKLGGNADELFRKAVCQNRRAAWCLESADPVREWLAVSISSFGRTPRPRAANVLTVGDAASFIDPFTGSGMLMALESSALLADAIAAAPNDPAAVRETYTAAYDRVFGSRLRVSSALRKISFMPIFPSAAIALLNLSEGARKYLAAATRSPRSSGPKRSRYILRNQ